MAQGTDERAAQAQEKLASSARTLKTSAVAQEDSADRRTELAADRTILAAERTYAAWMRTGLAALASGIGAKALLGDTVPAWMASGTAGVLELFAVFCFFAGVWRQFDQGAPPPRPDVRALPSWLLVFFNGFLALVALVVLVGFVLS
ncbi:YidH family protein [Parablastomonas sp. CN1-191]|uniref:YidH family protein n=1 Tax=Parablastomonas sp. CN1-191 TaxID=3400908 RepID=UPI003BF7E156